MSLLACRTEDQPLNVLVRSRLPELILNSAVVRAGAVGCCTNQVQTFVDHFGVRSNTRIYFFMLVLCLNTMATTINTNAPICMFQMIQMIQMFQCFNVLTGDPNPWAFSKNDSSTFGP